MYVRKNEIKNRPEKVGFFLPNLKFRDIIVSGNIHQGENYVTRKVF